MKKINLIKRLLSYSHEKQKPQRFGRYAAMLIMLLTLGVGQMWGWNVTEGTVYYFKPSTKWKEASPRFAVAYGIGDDTYGWYTCLPVSGETDVYYFVSPGNYDWMILTRQNPAYDENSWAEGHKWTESNRVQPNSNYNRFDVKGGSNWAYDFDWYKYAPPMESATLTNNSTIYGGDGTSGNPYQIKKGTTLSVTASANSYVANGYTKYYQFYKKEDSGSRSTWGDESNTTLTKTLTANAAAGHSYEIDVVARNEYYANYGKTATSSKMYFITVDPIYAILGDFNSWSRSESTWDLVDQGSGSNNWDATFTLSKGTHKFKVVHNSVYYGKNATGTYTTVTRDANTVSSLESGEGKENLKITADVTGTYTFRFNTSSKNLTVTYPNKYTVTTGAYPAAAASAPTISPALEDGYLAEGTSVTLTKQSANTGYTWKEWNSGSTGSGTKLGEDNTYSNTLSGNLSAYAIYTPNTYSVVFNKNHEDATGTMSNQAFTYAVAQNLTANAFVRDGYHFDGWATASDGNVVYNNGQSVSNLTAVDGGTVNLFAHWTKSELTNIALTPTNYAVQDEHPTITATPELSISSGIGTTSICWGLYTDAGCTTPVDGVSFSPNPSAGTGAVTFTAPNAAGTYYLKAIFREGSTCEGTELNSFTKSFIVHPTHTITIKAKVGEEFIPNAEYDQTSHTVIVNTHRATEVAVPDIPGYTFVNWTLGSNITKSSGGLTDDPIHITATADDNLTANYNYASYEVSYPSNAAYTISNNDASVTYKSTGHFTVEPAAGYSIVVTASDASGSIDIHQDVNNYSFTQGKYPVTITITPTEVTNTVTVVNGTPTSVTAQVVSTASADVTADPAPAGKKFLTWYLGTGIVLTKGDTTSRTIAFHASQNTTITAVYTDRSKVTVHFAKPFGWGTVKAKFYQGETAKTGLVEAKSTFTYEGATYYTFWYYTDNTGEDGGDQSAQASWDKVEFSDDGSTPHTKLTITNGNYYAKGGDAAGRATPYAEWYLRGDLNGEAKWGSDVYIYPFSVESSTLEYAFGATTGSKQYFRLYRTSTGQSFRTTASSPDAEITIGTTYTLAGNASNADYISTPAGKMGVYLFTLTNLNSATPSLTITHPEDTKYSASVTAGANGTITAATSSITQLGRYMPTTITANANAGYRFKEWVTTGGAKVKDPTNRSTTATATAAGTITATFTNEYIVYLDKAHVNSVWTSTPYVYFYSGSYWDNTKGSGSKNILWGGQAMTNIAGTTIWYYDYSGTKLVTDSKQYIAFTNGNKSGQDNFDEASVIYRSDYFPGMNMYVPRNYIDQYLNKHDSKQSAYYEQGYWMKYNEEESGYNLRVYDGQGNLLQETIHFTTSSVGSRDSYIATLHVDGAASAKFELIGHDQGNVHGVNYTGSFYGNTGTINWTISDWNWDYTKDKGKAYINFNSNGDYVFTLKCGTDGKMYVKVTYPISTGDFRINYNGLVTTEDGSKGNMYSDAIPHLTTDGTRKDTVSFFVTNQSGKEAALSLEKVSSINSSTGAISWGSALETFSGSAISSLESGVYMFEIVQTKSGATTSFTYTKLGKYDGKYYVRTDCANGGWVAYKQNSDNLMHETNYDKAGYNRYFCRYVSSGSVKFCVANDYNSQLSKQISSDALNTAGDGSITVGANTRFEYDNTTNKVSRSYVGSSADKEFLYIRDTDPDKIFKENGTSEGVTLTADTAKFYDNENWIYSLEVRAIPGAKYKLEAKINGNMQYFVGSEETDETLLGGSGSKQKMRLVYDFKNNHLIKAWLPSGVVSGTYNIDADVMLIREGQNAATQLSFSDGSKLDKVHNVYGVLGFSKTDMTNAGLSSYERSLYWVSFPFDVKLKDIFGFGKYGEDYIVRRYNGAKRAEKGWFKADGTTTFWEMMDPESDVEAENTMKAYEGYMVALDKGLFVGSDTRWYADKKAIDEIYLYFPSASDEIGELSKTDKVVTMASMKCDIDRTFAQDSELAEDKRRNHKNTDSNWRVVGVGSLHSTNITVTDLDNAATSIDYYAWDASLNKLNSTTCNQYGSGSPTTFLAGHAYMIQWEGKITWKSASVPAGIAARRTVEKKNYEIELDLNQNDIMYDRTYVVLQENASADYVLNEDLYKVTNSNYPNIYAFAGAYDCGVSRMPIENTTVPVGVIIRKNGNYTFTMPSNFDGTVTLIDTYAQTRTNLGLEDYEVYLNKGTMDDRFLLEININNAPTAIDGVQGGSLKDGKAHKFIQNGVMYILQDGKIYDARGAVVK